MQIYDLGLCVMYSAIGSFLINLNSERCKFNVKVSDFIFGETFTKQTTVFYPLKDSVKFKRNKTK